jgi:hypothetical protein
MGGCFEAAVAATGFGARLEKNGTLLLRSICKLVHMGHGEYAKGDGLQFKIWMDKHFPRLLAKCRVGRAEVSKRQDWACEVSEAIYPLLEPITKYLVETLQLDPNILRDSTLQRVELRHFQAYVYVMATMWVVAFGELRRLTNSPMVDLNSLELRDLYHTASCGLLERSFKRENASMLWKIITAPGVVFAQTIPRSRRGTRNTPLVCPVVKPPCESSA